MIHGLEDARYESDEVCQVGGKVSGDHGKRSPHMQMCASATPGQARIRNMECSNLPQRRTFNVAQRGLAPFNSQALPLTARDCPEGRGILWGSGLGQITLTRPTDSERRRSPAPTRTTTAAPETADEPPQRARDGSVRTACLSRPSARPLRRWEPRLPSATSA